MFCLLGKSFVEAIAHLESGRSAKQTFDIVTVSPVFMV